MTRRRDRLRDRPMRRPRPCIPPAPSGHGSEQHRAQALPPSKAPADLGGDGPTRLVNPGALSTERK